MGSALIYPPGSYADTGELRAFSQVLARHDAVHICHLRSEGQRLLESIEELIDIARTTGARGEIYHLKVAGKSHWHKMSEALQLVESAREGRRANHRGRISVRGGEHAAQCRVATGVSVS